MKIPRKIHFLFVKSLEIYSTIWKFCQRGFIWILTPQNLYLVSSGLSRLDVTLSRERNYSERSFAFPSSMRVHVTPTSKRQMTVLPLDSHENVKKIVLTSKTGTLLPHHTFLYTSFPFLHDYDVKISRLLENVNKRRWNFISIFELG